MFSVVFHTVWLAPRVPCLRCVQGDGVVLLRDGGLPAGSFVGEYLGELYAAWRWLERDNRTREWREAEDIHSGSVQ